MAGAFALGDGPDACLLLHGLTGSPADVRPVGEALAQAGIRAVAPLLPGHGTRPEDLFDVGRFELVQAARTALLDLRGARRLYLCGLSAGALIALHLAAQLEGLPELTALALLAPAIEFRGSTWIFAHVVGRLPALRILVGDGRRRDIQSAAEVEAGYSLVPMRWTGELRVFSSEAFALARRVRAPTLILQGALDRTVKPSGAHKLAKQLGSQRVDLRMFPRSGHTLPLDQESAEVCCSVVSFFQGVV